MLRIIHLSDFHLNKNNVSDWNSYVKDALFKLLKDKIDINTTFFICTGDLVDKGGKDYSSIEDAFNEFKKQVITPICDFFSLPYEHFIITPGNHDIVRNAEPLPHELGYKEYFSQDYNNVLNFMKDVIEKNSSDGLKRIIPFKDFEDSLYPENANIKKSIFGTTLKFDINGEKVGFSCLNSSWRAYGDDDLNSLIIGEKQLTWCKNNITDCEVKIAIAHHPLDWLLPKERSTITDHVYKDYDLLFLGHVHENKTTIQTGFSGNIFVNIAPACISDIRSESKAFSNGISIIDFDKRLKEIDCKFYIYNHSNRDFILNTKLGDNGRFCQKIPNGNSASIKQIIEKSLTNIKQEHYPIINEHVIAHKANIVKSIEEAFVLPPIKNATPTATSDDDIVGLNEVIRENSNCIFFANQEIGKTTFLYRLAYEYTEKYTQLRKVPVYIDVDEMGNKEIITIIKSYLSCNTEEAKTLLSEESLILLVDNLDYVAIKEEQSKRIYNFINEYQNLRIIATAKLEMEGFIPTTHLNNNRIAFKNFFINPFTTKQVKSLMKIWTPSEEPIKFNEKLDKMVNNFASYSLPCTAMSVSLFLWGTENSNKQPINQAVLLDICIELMLDKLAKENIYRSSFDYRNKCMLLAKIAQEMRESDLSNCAIPYSKFVNIIESYLKDDVGFDYDANIIAEYFIKRKLFLKISNNHIKFSHSCFFHFFIAKRMEFDIKYREFVLDENNFHNFHKEIDYYSGLTRNDKDLLTTIYERFTKDFSPLEFVFEQVDIDTFFTHVRKGGENHESTAKSIDIQKIKSNRPSEEQINAFYDKRLSRSKDSIVKRDGGVISLEQLLIMICNVLRNSEGVEDLNLKKEIYNSIIHNSIAWVVLYKEWIIHYIQKNNELPPSIPNDISLDFILQYLPFNMQFGLQNNLGTNKLSSVILNKIKQDQTNSKCSDVEAYLSVALYTDENGKDFDKYFKKLIKNSSNNIVRYYCDRKLTYLLYLKTKEGSDQEDIYIDLLTELKIRSQKLSRRLTEQVKKSFIDGKKRFLGEN